MTAHAPHLFAATLPSAAPAGASRRTYQYRGTPKPDPGAASAAEIRDLLEQQRQIIAMKSSRLRALSSALSERVAQAISDGAKVAAVARVAGLPAASVRGMRSAREESYPSGRPVQEQLRGIAAVADELSSVETARTAVEHERAQALATARKLRLLDDYQLASASGLKHEEIRKMTRGLGVRRAS